MQKQIVRNESMRTVIRYAFWLLSLFLMSEIQAVTPQKAPLKLGAERMDVVTRLLKDKQVGLVVNQTSILEKQQKHLLDALLEEGINIKKVFAPEHGFRGTADAGAEIKDSRDVKTGVPIISLYGKNKKPTAEQLAGLDVVVFDIQDVGVRFYTYISTMHYVMEACAENDVEFIALDRPNPNDFVDGPVRQKGFESFVGVDPLPILHGLTVGELAWMINKEGWLKSTPDTCKLHIVKMENWRHGDPYWLPVKPSPNLPNMKAVYLYPATCYFEATPVSLGRGTSLPFQVYGHPNMTGYDYSFTPKSVPGAKNPPQLNKLCHGVNLSNMSDEEIWKRGVDLSYVIDAYKNLNIGDHFFRPFFELLVGTDYVRKMIIEGKSAEEIKNRWKGDVEKFKEQRKPYLLYQE